MNNRMLVEGAVKVVAGRLLGVVRAWEDEQCGEEARFQCWEDKICSCLLMNEFTV